METLLISFLFAIVASLASLLGGVMATQHKWAKHSLRYFIALGAGYMLGAVFMEMIPKSIELEGIDPAGVSSRVLLGYLIVHLFEHAFASHLHFGEETHHDEVGHASVEFSALVGLLVHSFFDGVSIAVGFSLDEKLGILIFLAQFLHKIPDGFTIASLFVASGHSNARALGTAGALGISTLAGVAALSLAGANAAVYALPLAAGSMLYVAATDLMPEANRETGVRMAFLVFAGVALFFLSKTLFGE